MDGETKRYRKHAPEVRTAMIRLRVTPTAKLQYEAVAVRRGVTLSELIETLLRDAAVADRVI